MREGDFILVGNKEINLEELKRKSVSYGTLDSYCLSLVPKYIRHNQTIVNNQKYLVALYLRRIESIPYKKRMDLCEHLLHNVRVTGVTTTILDFNDIIMETDIEKLIKYILQKERSNE